MTTQPKYTPAEQLADNILKASGSALRHYTVAKTLEAIIAEAQKPLTINAALVEALEICLDMRKNPEGVSFEAAKKHLERCEAALALAKGE